MKANHSGAAAASTNDGDSSHATAQQHQKHKAGELSRFFHALSHKLMLADPATDHDMFIGDLGFDLDFIGVLTHPPAGLMGEGAACMQMLQRVDKAFVLSKEEVNGVGAVVSLELTVAPRTDLPAQGIFHPSTTAKKYVLARPFEEYRKLRKVIQYMVSCKAGSAHEREHKHFNGASGAVNQGTHGSTDRERGGAGCSFCTSVEDYARWCWEQPPLLATNVFSKLALFKKLVLTNSLAYFVHLARTQVAAAATSSQLERSFASDRDTPTSNTVTLPDNDRSDVDLVPVTPLPAVESEGGSVSEPRLLQFDRADSAQAPFCPAQAKLAILLCDFFQLQSHA